MDTDNYKTEKSDKINRQSEFNLEGLGVALVTPFKEDKSIDYDALSNLVEFLINGKINYLVILGTTAETPTLTSHEKEEIRQFIKNKVNGRVPLILGLGGNCTSAIVDELTTMDLNGFYAILSVTPYYNKPTQEGLYAHYSEISKASPLPVILYNVPGRTGINMLAETTLRLARDCENIIAIKEASGNVEQIEKIILNKPNDFKVISGDDSLTFTLIKKGASGVISVAGNAFPVEFGEMVNNCLAGNYENASKLNDDFYELYDALFYDGNPAGIKCMLHEMNLLKNELRLPLVKAKFDTQKKIRNILYRIKGK